MAERQLEVPGVGLIFAANGHFDDVGAYGSYHVTNLGQVIYETHSTWPGSGPTNWLATA